MRMLAALSNNTGIVILILGGILVLASGAIFTLWGRTRERGPDVPNAMKPGPSDPALETPLLQKLQGWGVLLIAFSAAWLAFAWFNEPGTNLHQEESLKTDAIARGAAEVQLFGETNQLGVGCVRCHGPELRGVLVIQFADPVTGQTKYDTSADLQTVCGGPWYGHGAIHDTEDIQTTIEQGRYGTPMPSWSIKYAGALDDQQINDLVNYIVWMSSKHVTYNHNVCTNPYATQVALAKASNLPLPPKPSASTSTGGSTSPSASSSSSGSATPTPTLSPSPSETLGT